MPTKEIIVFSNDQELRNMIAGFKGCSMATVDMTTKPKCTVNSRTKNSKGEKITFAELYKDTILKTSTRFVSIGNEYATSINNRLIKEGKIEKGEKSFDSDSLPFGNWVKGSKILIEYNDCTYIRISYLNANGKNNEEIFHYGNGETIEGAELEYLKVNFLPIKKTAKKQLDVGIEKPIVINSVKLSNMIRLKFDGKIFVRENYLTSEDNEAIREAKKVWGDTMKPETKELLNRSMIA